ncbi:MAG TPA: acetyl-CoA carboxylase biotin carboxyl carrier protein [Deinococcales bacterium]|nr:acetyl-CoA carboxylase biotin carboxyl carrier protein [Deinococcales bacterium]
MELAKLKKLLKAVADAEVNEFSLTTDEYTISLKRGEPAPVAVQQQVVPVAGVPPEAPAAAEQAPAADSGVAAALEPDLAEVTAPIVGTFYEAPAPDAAAYVQVGDHVSKGTVLCIIEAMKLMNEIEAEVDGVIAEILVNNEDPVEYGQSLFRIRPV